MLKLAQRMTNNFCAGVSASTAHTWTTLSGTGDDDVRVMTRKSVDNPGEPHGVVLSAATSLWLPITPQRVFEFLRDERVRSEVRMASFSYAAASLNLKGRANCFFFILAQLRHVCVFLGVCM